MREKKKPCPVHTVEFARQSIHDREKQKDVCLLKQNSGANTFSDDWEGLQRCL